MAYFRDWFFNQFPSYHQVNDTYKNNLGEGVWQRYLRSYGDELDENFIPYLENFLDLIDYLKCDDKFLPLIGSILGYPPSITGLPATYRKILAYVVAVYKVKGSCKSYEIMFNLLGLNIELDMDIPKRRASYDPFPKITYDEDDPAQYDSECEYCTDYRIKYTTQDGNPIADEILLAIPNIICFIEPINAKFGGMVQGRIFDDSFDDSFN